MEHQRTTETWKTCLHLGDSAAKIFQSGKAVAIGLSEAAAYDHWMRSVQDFVFFHVVH